MKIKRIWIITMFEEYFTGLKEFGVLGSALRNERGEANTKYEFHTIHLPNFSKKGFKGVDAPPFGGGAGMVMRPDVLEKALLEGIVAEGGYDTDKIKEQLHVVCPAPRGKVWCHESAVEFAENSLSFNQSKDIVFVCGRYEGIDERFLEKYVDEYISLGDYILTGGELAVMIILDSAMRFADGVLGNKESYKDESFANGLLEYPLYTRPQAFEGHAVPEILLSGHHEKIQNLKFTKQLEMTKKYRVDLYNLYVKKN